MANLQSITSKRVQLDKETKSMVISVTIAVFIVLFCIFSAHSLATVSSYQSRVIGQQNIAEANLTQDLNAVSKLENSYKAFNNSSGNNLLNQSASGTGPNQGDNAKLVLDALPSVVDYPALVVSIQNLLTSQPGISLQSLNVTNPSSGTSAASAGTTTVQNIGTAQAIPVNFTVTGSLANLEALINYLNNSIMPIQFQSVVISTTQTGSNLSMDVSAQTFYQPAISFNVSTEIVK